jgi:cobalt-zinc-cadmium efflux system protein
MVAEAIGGVISGSLALLADAGHMLADVGALALAYAGIRLGRRPRDARRSYGYQRAEVLAAFVNGLTLIAVAAWIVLEAFGRFLAPAPVLSGPMLVIAVLGLAVNLASFFILRGGEQNLNVKGAIVHVMGDLAGSAAAIVAALVISFTGWTPIDPLLAALVAVLIARSAFDLVRRSGHILLEGAPEGIDREAMARRLGEIPGVERAHHIHLWSLTSGQVLATLHVQCRREGDPHAIVALARECLRVEFDVTHATIEVETGPEPESCRLDRA